MATGEVAQQITLGAGEFGLGLQPREDLHDQIAGVDVPVVGALVVERDEGAMVRRRSSVS